MKPEEIAKELVRMLRQWPAGLTVWHKGNGERGVVIEHVVEASGHILLTVSFDPGNFAKCGTVELSATPVPDDDDEWKQPKPESDK